MVRKYKRITNRAAYGQDTISRAVADIESGRLTISRASHVYEIPYITLYKRVKHLRGHKSQTQGRPPVLSADVESNIANNLRTMEKWGYGLSTSEFKEKVRDFVTANNISNPFKNNIPGDDWMSGFKKRHSLSVKKPQSLEYCRKKCTDPFLVNEYFDLLKNALEELGLTDAPGQVFNLDETSLCTDPSRVKVIGAKGKPSSRIIAGSGKENVTVLAGASAAGEKLSPLVIFKGNHVWSSWIPDRNEETFKGMTFAASPNGWMTAEIFRNYFTKYFLPHVAGRGPILVIYDGHVSHVDNALIEHARHANVHILKLPAHTSHLLQPLDLAVFKSFKAKWDQKLTTWQRTHQGTRLPKKEFTLLLGDTWSAVDSEIIRNGFKKGGIFPFDRTVVAEEKYDIQALKRWKRRNHITAENEEDAIDKEGEQPDENAQEVNQNNAIFENILLETVKATTKLGTNSKRRKRSNAELITSTLQECGSLNKETENNRSDDEAELLSKEAESINKEYALINEEIVPSNQFHEEPLPLNKKIASLVEDNNCRNEEEQSLISNSFQQLLLDSVKQSSLQATLKRKRLAPGAEIVTARSNISFDPQPSTSKLNVILAIPKANKRKRKSIPLPKTPVQSSESDEESVLYEESDQSFTLDSSDNEDRIPTMDKTNIETGSWVLVSYASKKTLKHFIGQVKGISKIQEFEVKFVRKFKENFVWPQVDDIDIVSLDNIVTSLPTPTVSRRGTFHFPVDFAGYNI